MGIIKGISFFKILPFVKSVRSFSCDFVNRMLEADINAVCMGIITVQERRQIR